MKKLAVRDLVEFRRKSEAGKKTFVANLRSPKVETTNSEDAGGDYWVIAISAICNAYKEGTATAINEKIEEVREKLADASRSQTKDMYEQNINALNNYRKLNLKSIKPPGKLSYLKRSKAETILTIKGFEIEAKPSIIYSFGKEDGLKVGAIWFTAKINGYTEDELSLFCEVQHRFLRENYSKDYEIPGEYCIVVDAYSNKILTYADVLSKSYNVLNSTLNAITKLL